MTTAAHSRPTRPGPPTRHGRTKAAVVAVVVFASTLGGAALAATLDNTAGDLGSDVAQANCQSAAVTPSWEYTFDPSIPGYRVSAVTLAGLEAGCLSKNVSVVLANSSGVSQAVGSGTIPAAGDTATIPLSTGFNLALTWVGQLTVVIHS